MRKESTKSAKVVGNTSRDSSSIEGARNITTEQARQQLRLFAGRNVRSATEVILGDPRFGEFYAEQIERLVVRADSCDSADLMLSIRVSWRLFIAALSRGDSEMIKRLGVLVFRCLSKLLELVIDGLTLNGFDFGEPVEFRLSVHLGVNI